MRLLPKPTVKVTGWRQYFRIAGARFVTLLSLSLLTALGVYVLTLALGYQNALLWLVIPVPLVVLMAAFIVRDLILRRSSAATQAGEDEITEFVKYDVNMMIRWLDGKKFGTWHNTRRLLWRVLIGVFAGIFALIAVLQLQSPNPSTLLSAIGAGGLIGYGLYYVTLKLLLPARVIVPRKSEHKLNPTPREANGVLAKRTPLLANTPVKVVGCWRYFSGKCLRSVPLLGISILIDAGVYGTMSALGYGGAPWIAWQVLIIPVLFILFTVGFVVRDVVLRRSSSAVEVVTARLSAVEVGNLFLFWNFGAKKTVTRQSIEYFGYTLVLVAAIILILSLDLFPNLPEVSIPVFLTVIANCVIAFLGLGYVVAWFLLPKSVASPR